MVELQGCVEMTIAAVMPADIIEAPLVIRATLRYRGQTDLLSSSCDSVSCGV